MSYAFQNAVTSVGPVGRPTLRHVLSVMATVADDWGFLVMEVATIADKTQYDEKTVRRALSTLEEEEWLRVDRKVMGGRGNVYTLSGAKFGVAPSPKSARSPVWADMQRLSRALNSGGRVSGGNGVLKFEKPTNSKEKIESGVLFEEETEENSEGTVPGEFGAESSAKDDKSPESPGIWPETVEKPRESTVESKNSQGTVPGDTGHGGGVTADIVSGPFNVLPVTYQLKETTTPLTPLRSEGGTAGVSVPASRSRRKDLPDEGQKPEDVRDLAAAVAKVKRECSLSEPRLHWVIDRAMREEAAKTDEAAKWNEIGERMIAAWLEYVELGRLNVLRYPVRPRRFFAEGLWRNKGLWVFDEDTARRLREANRGRL